MVLNKKIEETFAVPLIDWFKKNKRDFPWRRETDPFRILVVEKLLQQTTYGHVLKVYFEFFEKFPNIPTLEKAEVSEIENTIRRLGFQRQRARQLKGISAAIISQHHGNIPSNKDDLLRLNGVGNYIANAVLCFAFNKDEPIVDTNVKRVTGRYFDWNDIKNKVIQERLRKMIPKGKAREFNWGIIDFSAIICSRTPKCKKCFMNENCCYFKS